MVLLLLDKLHWIYKADCALQAEGQKKLTSYGFTIIQDDKDDDD